MFQVCQYKQGNETVVIIRQRYMFIHLQEYILNVKLSLMMLQNVQYIRYSFHVMKNKHKVLLFSCWLQAQEHKYWII